MNWLRRPTGAEVADAIAAEEKRREDLLLLADQQLPTPEFGPLPTGNGMTRSVYACATHAITLDAASRIHASSCMAPDPAVLPGCDCTPEVQAPTPPSDSVPVKLPEHWFPATDGQA
ncbi:hypothetical protein [Streptomyces cavernae]|uniref:hypothetical protein n=1 Tax=Streptomyces cavernae TaxID=2259034 RepID=UPI000FEB9E0B|nr:hypothetical protein [Streptomyces cavernae]